MLIGYLQFLKTDIRMVLFSGGDRLNYEGGLKLYGVAPPNSFLGVLAKNSIIIHNNQFFLIKLA